MEKNDFVSDGGKLFNKILIDLIVPIHITAFKINILSIKHFVVMIFFCIIVTRVLGRVMNESDTITILDLFELVIRDRPNLMSFRALRRITNWIW